MDESIYASMSISQACAILELPDVNGELTSDDVKIQFRKMALKWHPDKNNGSEAAAETFKKVTIAHALLMRVIENGAGKAEFNASSFDFAGWSSALQRASLDDILKLALAGMDITQIEELLQVNGAHRPPENFGIAPYPRFDAPNSAKRTPCSQSLVDNSTLKESWKNTVVDDGSDDSDQERKGNFDMEAIFKRIEKVDGLDSESEDLDDEC
ncbi:hypothetical protein CYMTET_39228 [Cymbomonas tetramitiformis]|uniref:J domain-containing protein n=1 Tax=Cymbomonas tetramitiformis TaxID=36881 RepID=A0AAE0CAG4_9CHLO|nr:hypothetical protein CYMTET_39228 [Cymbomonas tetramitiformis]